MDDPAPPDPGREPGQPPVTQHFQHAPVSARVPEKVGRGVFSTAIMVLQTGDLFVLDFLSMMVHPQQVVARVVMHAPSFGQLIGALRQNVGAYEKQYGALTARAAPGASGQPTAGAAPSPAGGAIPMPGSGVTSTSSGDVLGRAPAPEATPITDLYEQLKFPDELLGGAFANSAMIRHTPEEFCFDFIANLFPRPVVVARVYAAAGRMPAIIEAMNGAMGRYQAQRNRPPEPPAGPPGEPPEGVG